MPTSRPRYTITETDEVARALDNAARRWPADKDARARLLLRLINKANHDIEDEDERKQAERLAALARTHGAFTGLYEPGYLEELREDWPE